MRSEKVATIIPEISDSLLAISLLDAEALTGLYVGHLGGDEDSSDTSADNDEPAEETQDGRPLGSLSDLSQLGFLRMHTLSYLSAPKSIEYSSDDEAFEISMAALARIAEDSASLIYSFGKWNIGREVKSMARFSLNHLFPVKLAVPELSGATNGDVSVARPQISPGYIAEYRSSFAVLKPFFSRTNRQKIQAAERQAATSPATQ